MRCRTSGRIIARRQRADRRFNRAAGRRDSMRQVGRRLQPARQPEHVLAGAERSFDAKRHFFGAAWPAHRSASLARTASLSPVEYSVSDSRSSEVVGPIELEDEGRRSSIDSLLGHDDHTRQRAVLIANQHRMHGPATRRRSAPQPWPVLRRARRGQTGLLRQRVLLYRRHSGSFFVST